MTVAAVKPKPKAVPAKPAAAQAVKPPPPAAPPRRSRVTPLTPMRQDAAKSMAKLADSMREAHPDMEAHRHVRDAARMLRAGQEEAAQRHLRAAMFAMTPQSLMRNGLHTDDSHTAARSAMHGIHRHLLLVKDIADVAAKNQEALRKDSYGDDSTSNPPPRPAVHADPNAGYGPGALAQKPTARQPPGDQALNAPARTSSGGSDPAVADPVGPQPRGSKQFARTWDDLCRVIALTGDANHRHIPGSPYEWEHGYVPLTEAAARSHFGGKAPKGWTAPSGGGGAGKAAGSSPEAAAARKAAEDVRFERGLTRFQREEAGQRLNRAARYLDDGDHGEAAAELDAAMHVASLRGGGVIKGSAAAQARDLRNKVRAGLPAPGGGAAAGKGAPAGPHPADKLTVASDPKATARAMSDDDLQRADTELSRRATLLGKAGQKSRAHKAVVTEMQRRGVSMSVTWDDLASVIEMATQPAQTGRMETRTPATAPTARGHGQVYSGDPTCPIVNTPRIPTTPGGTRRSSNSGVPQVSTSASTAAGRPPIGRRSTAGTERTRTTSSLSASAATTSTTDLATGATGASAAVQQNSRVIRSVRSTAAEPKGRPLSPANSGYPSRGSTTSSTGGLGGTSRELSVPTSRPDAFEASTSLIPGSLTSRSWPSTAAGERIKLPLAASSASPRRLSGRSSTDVRGLTSLDLSAETERLAVTPHPYGKPGGPGLYHVAGNRHSPYFENIVKALMTKRGMDKGRASAVAWGVLRKWSHGGGGVHPEVAAAAGRALAGEAAASAKAHSHAVPEGDVTAVGLASANGHHVPGTDYEWKHGYIPLTHAAGKSHFKGKAPEGWTPPGARLEDISVIRRLNEASQKGPAANPAAAAPQPTPVRYLSKHEARQQHAARMRAAGVKPPEAPADPRRAVSEKNSYAGVTPAQRQYAESLARRHGYSSISSATKAWMGKNPVQGHTRSTMAGLIDWLKNKDGPVQAASSYDWDDLTRVVEMATVLEFFNPAQPRVPAGQAGGGQFGSGSGAGQQAKGKAPAKAPAKPAPDAHQLHVAHVAHVNKVSTQKAQLLVTAQDDRQKASALIKHRNVLEKELASASGKVSTGQSGATTSANATTSSSAPAAPASTTAPASASTAPSTASASTTPASGTATATAPASGSAAQITAQIAALNQQINGLLQAAAQATAQAAKIK